MEKTKIKNKEAGNGPFIKYQCMARPTYYLGYNNTYIKFVSPYLHWQNTFATYSLGSKWLLIRNVIGASFTD